MSDDIDKLRRVAIAATRLRLAFPPEHRFPDEQWAEFNALFDALDGWQRIADAKVLALPVAEWKRIEREWVRQFPITQERINETHEHEAAEGRFSRGPPNHHLRPDM